MIDRADDAVLYETRGHVALVTLNRPDKRNAVNRDIVRGLDACLKRSEADPAIRAVVLTGAGEQAFCAGADLGEVARGEIASLYSAAGGFAGFVHYPRTRPWIAAPRGAALAGGLELCLACDMIVAADTCRFGLPETKRGLIASAGGITRLPRILPLPIALELIATGDPIDAARAFALGLVNRVVPAGETVAAALALAEAIAANAPLAVREAIAVARAAATLDDAAANRLSAAAQARIERSEDFREGSRAFVEKRAPVWQGR